MLKNTRNIFIFLAIVIIIVYYLHSSKEGFQIERFSIINTLFNIVFVIFIVMIFLWLFGTAFDFGAKLPVADKVKKRYGNRTSNNDGMAYYGRNFFS